MNKVDLDLFILCRLCLEKGTYQIIPSIQEQIKTCYGIVVDVFDGLPQLICQKCKTNVEHHYTTKLLYIEKQNSLKQRIESQKALEKQESEVTIPHELTISKRPKLRKLSSNTEESSTSVNVNELESTSWESDYRKQYYCRLCNYIGKSMKSINLHRLWHTHLEDKHCGLFNKYCYVKLDKIDEKPNVTGRYDTVMLNNKKIIKSHDKYFITYTPKRSLRCSDNESPERIRIPSKRNRILSNSSGETVVFDANENENITQGAKVNESIAQDAKANDSITQSKENIENDCIQISSDESNTDEEEADRSIIKKPLLVKSNDFKTIENISSNCYSKYMKKMEDKKAALPVCSTHMESQLNHKVLCIGRKVLLNGNYMNCNGLFRFLEYKNLPIIWVPYLRDSNIVIRTFLKSNVQDACDDINWSYMFKTGTENVTLDTYSASVALKRNQLNIDKLQTTLVPIPAESVETKCKILNANPVPNPKQMPSKVNNEVKSGNKSKSDININDTGIEIDSEENHFSLPIITHTTSLAPITNEKPIYPKIKVKSVSELMTEEALKNLATEQVPLNFMSGDSVSDSATELNSVKENHGINFYLPNIPEGPSHEARNNIHTLKATSKNNNQVPENSQTFINNTTSIVNEKKVILDTAEFPHTKTNSPFQYLKNLLLCHNITLIDSRAEIISEFSCLIKFKVAFKQDLTEPVIFDMQLYYSMGSFCIKVKDKNLGDIAFEILTADWQWEIIKTLKGGVMNKILSNAKKVSMTAFKDTEKFLLLLNSIKCQRVD